MRFDWGHWSKPYQGLWENTANKERPCEHTLRSWGCLQARKRALTRHRVFCFTLSPRLECSSVIWAHCSLCLLGSIATRFHHVGQVGLELLTSSDLLALASQSAAITGMSYCTQPHVYCLSHPMYDGVSLLLLRLKCSDVISAHCHLLASGDSPVSASGVAGITDMCYHGQLIFVFLVEMGFCHVDQASLELLISGNPPASASQSAGITDVVLYPSSSQSSGGRTELHLVQVIAAWRRQPGSGPSKEAHLLWNSTAPDYQPVVNSVTVPSSFCFTDEKSLKQVKEFSTCQLVTFLAPGLLLRTS
ncbi:hypothetical protein AAY473_036576 [Plecturocebus cupreus]